MNNSNDYPCLTPNVVFAEALKEIADNEYLLFYGANDSTIGIA